MTITYEQISAFEAGLVREEAASSTVKRYTGIVREFALYLGERKLTKEILLEWRETLGVCPATANVAAAAINRFLSFLGLQGMNLKYRKVQRSIFRPAEKELTKEEYKKLVRTAEQGKKTRLARAIETICPPGDSGQRAQVRDGGSSESKICHDPEQGKGPYHPSGSRAGQEAERLCKGERDPEGRNLCHQKRQGPFQDAALGRDESPLQKGRSGS